MSTTARSLMALVFLAGAAQAQPPTQRGRGTTIDQARLVQQPPARTLSHQSATATIASSAAVHRVSHMEPASPNDNRAPMPLRASSKPQRLTQPPSKANRGQRTATTVLGSLAVVLASFFVLVWLSRKTAPMGLAPLPSEVCESLGRAPLTARQQMQLIRLGNKLVLLSVTSTGAETLTEITDIDEVNRLAGLCQQGRSGSISATFRQVLSQYETEPAPNGFVGDPSVSQVVLANRSTRRMRQTEDDRA